MAALTPEGKVKRKLDRLLKQLGVWYFCPMGGAFGKAGIPDRIAIVRGRFIGIEVKADEKSKPTALQLKCGEQIEAAGGVWFLVNGDATLAAMEKVLRAMLEDVYS